MLKTNLVTHDYEETQEYYSSSIPYAVVFTVELAGIAEVQRARFSCKEGRVGVKGGYRAPREV